MYSTHIEVKICEKNSYSAQRYYFSPEYIHGCIIIQRSFELKRLQLADTKAKGVGR
jgi:hypothetical protein